MKTSQLQGFTLIELLLYLTIISVMVAVISSFMFMILQVRIKNQTIAEVEQQGLQVMQIMTQTIRNATSLNAAPGWEASIALSINTPVSANNPTLFNLSSGHIQIKEGSANAVALTSDRITASNLLFQNLSRSGTSPLVRISFTLNAVNTSGRNEYSYSKTFFTSVQLRP